jgi:hypothetical protein
VTSRQIPLPFEGEDLARIDELSSRFFCVQNYLLKGQVLSE